MWHARSASPQLSQRASQACRLGSTGLHAQRCTQVAQPISDLEVGPCEQRMFYRECCPLSSAVCSLLPLQHPHHTSRHRYPSIPAIVTSCRTHKSQPSVTTSLPQLVRRSILPQLDGVSFSTRWICEGLCLNGMDTDNALLFAVLHDSHCWLQGWRKEVARRILAA